MDSLLLALGFLTTFPLPRKGSQIGDLARAAAWFSFVGLLIGIILLVLRMGLNMLFPPLLGAAITLSGWVLITGGLHLDGLTDCYDALLAPVSQERRLVILKDPHVGAFAVIGLVLHLLLKFLAIYTLDNMALITRSIGRLPIYQLSGSAFALLLAPVIGRWSVLFVARKPAARKEGLGVALMTHLSKQSLAIASLIPLILIILGGWQAVIAAIAGGCVSIGIGYLAMKRLGGVTGDVLGLTIEISELVVLLAYAGNYSLV